jgi:hypothetical protein
MRCGYPRSDTSRLIFGELERTKPRAPEGLAHAAEHPPKADSFYAVKPHLAHVCAQELTLLPTE